MISKYGRVAEWFKAAVLKTARGASPSWVRIPPLPLPMPNKTNNDGPFMKEAFIGRQAGLQSLLARVISTGG